MNTLPNEEGLFQAAVALPVDDGAAFLDRKCFGEPAVGARFDDPRGPGNFWLARARRESLGLAACLAVGAIGSACKPSGGGPDASLHIYDLSSGQKVYSLVGHNRPTTALAVSADGKFALTASMTRELRLWSLQDRREVRSIDPFQSQANAGPGPYLGSGHSVTFLEGARLALVGHEQAGFSIWDLESNKVVRTFRTPVRDASAVVVSADGATVTLSDALHPVAVTWRLADGGHQQIFAEQWQGDSAYITLAHNGRPRSWWHSITGERQPEGMAASGGIQARHSHQATLSPDGRRLLTYYGGVENQPRIHRFRVWDIESGRLLCQRSELTLPIAYSGRPYSRCESIAFSPDSLLLAVGLRDGRIEIRETEGGGLVREWATPPKACDLVAFLPDARRLLTWGGAVMRLWEVETGELVRAFDAPIVCGMAPTPDGRFLLVGGTGEFRGL